MTPLKLRHQDNQFYHLKEWNTLGSDTGCDLQVPGSGVEGRHVRIERRDTQWVVKDLRSSQGTWINGARVVEAFLQDGDILRLGQTEVFVLADSPRREQGFPLTSQCADWNEILQSLEHVSKTEFPVLLLGPSGTGKDVIAQKIHEHSSRRRGPLVSVNCGALTESLVESELFGHVKGSFTGALSDRKGAFEAARGGTLFLDEIGDLPMTLQSKLLRALENQEIRPVGSDRTLKTDVRILAATHQDLEERIRDGRFRQDLYFRLNVVAIHPPPLKNRMEDFEGLLYEFCRQLRVRFSVAAIKRLEQHNWPGNIRELKNFVSRASALFPQTSIEVSHVEKLLNQSRLANNSYETQTGGNQGTLPVIQEIEKQMILKRLRANKGNQRRTAQDLGLPKSTLHDRIRWYGIDLSACK